LIAGKSRAPGRVNVPSKSNKTPFIIIFSFKHETFAFSWEQKPFCDNFSRDSEVVDYYSKRA